jgi:molybdopterin converting factor small subunit
MSTTENKEEAYKLSKELISNNDAIDALKAKMKGHKESIKAYDERNAVIMGEIRVYVEEDGAKPADTEDESGY